MDEQTVTVTSSNSKEKEMETNEQPFEMAAPFEQQKNLKWNALAAGMRRSTASSALSQQKAMEISQEQLQGNRPVAGPFRELVDTKRPLASTVGLFGETASPVKAVMPGEEHMMQSVTQRQAIYPAMQSVMQPVTQPAMQPAW